MGQIIPFPGPAGITDVRPVQPEVVADLLLALEDAPLFDAPIVVVRKGPTATEVRVGVSDRDHRLTPAEARLAADALAAELAFAGCLLTAASLREAATLAEQMRRAG